MGVEKTKDKRILELDVLRGLAAIGVVIYHYTCYYQHNGFSFKYGKTGVELFFMISGFVIFMSLTHVRQGREFVANRIARLYPVYWACLTFTFLLRILNFAVFDRAHLTFSFLYAYLVNLSMFQYFFNVANIDGPYWSLIIEMVFYVFIFILYKLRALRHIEVIGTVLLLVIFLLQIIPLPGVQAFNAQFMQRFPLATYWALFLAGIVFYKSFTEKETPARYAILAACYLFEITQYQYREFQIHAITQFEYIIILGFYFILFYLFTRRKLGFMISAPTLYLGKISYSLYLVHAFLGIYVLMPLFNHRLHLPFWPSITLTVIIVIGIADLINRFVEIPGRVKLKEVMVTMLRIPRTR